MCVVVVVVLCVCVVVVVLCVVVVVLCVVIVVLCVVVVVFCVVVVVFCVLYTSALSLRCPQSTVVRCYRSVNVYHVEGVRHWANRTDMSPPGTCMTHDPNNL